MIIIFEGADDTGKTNIAKALAERLTIPYFKNSTESEHFQTEELRLVTKYAGTYMLDFLKQTDVSAIFDRSYPSEFAYARALGRAYDENIISYLDREYSKLGAIIVYCSKHGEYPYDDHLVPFTKVERIKREFQNFLNVTLCNSLHIDTTEEDLEYQIETILRFLEKKAL